MALIVLCADCIAGDALTRSKLRCHAAHARSISSAWRSICSSRMFRMACHRDKPRLAHHASNRATSPGCNLVLIMGPLVMQGLLVFGRAIFVILPYYIYDKWSQSLMVPHLFDEQTTWQSSTDASHYDAHFFLASCRALRIMP